jgi:hypothetical protein
MKIISALLVGCLLSSQSFASCNWEKDVKVNQDGSYTYSKDCHLQVGLSLDELDLRRKQVAELNKTIELKDLAIRYSDERVRLWMDSSLKMNERLNQYEATKGSQQWLYFGLGVLTTSLAVYGASSLIKR